MKYLKKSVAKLLLIRLSETIDATSTELVRVAKQLGFEGILAKRRDSYYRIRASEAVRGSSIVSTEAKNLSSAAMFQETPSIPSSSGTIKMAHCCTRARCETALFPHTRRAVAAKLERPRNRHLPICESARAQTHAVGLDEGRDEKLQMGEARGGRADRVYRVDTGCASTAIRFRRPARRQRPA